MAEGWNYMIWRFLPPQTTPWFVHPAGRYSPQSQSSWRKSGSNSLAPAHTSSKTSQWGTAPGKQTLRNLETGEETKSMHEPLVGRALHVGNFCSFSHSTKGLLAEENPVQWQTGGKHCLSQFLLCAHELWRQRSPVGRVGAGALNNILIVSIKEFQRQALDLIF